jgi:hypothetical protein
MCWLYSPTESAKYITGPILYRTARAPYGPGNGGATTLYLDYLYLLHADLPTLGHQPGCRFRYSSQCGIHAAVTRTSKLTCVPACVPSKNAPGTSAARAPWCQCSCATARAYAPKVCVDNPRAAQILCELVCMQWLRASDLTRLRSWPSVQSVGQACRSTPSTLPCQISHATCGQKPKSLGYVILHCQHTTTVVSIAGWDRLFIHTGIQLLSHFLPVASPKGGIGACLLDACCLCIFASNADVRPPQQSGRMFSALYPLCNSTPLREYTHHPSANGSHLPPPKIVASAIHLGTTPAHSSHDLLFGSNTIKFPHKFPA